LMKNIYGLIGFPLDHSWSPSYFQKRFLEMGLKNHDYQLYPLESLDQLPSLLERTPNLHGLNVTIPYKESILSFIDIIDPVAKEIGAVNTIRIQQSGNKHKLIGYNTDAGGFASSADFSNHRAALILGTGGASRAVTYALRKMGITCTLVSSKGAQKETLSYDDLDQDIIDRHTLIINTTPLGMYPNTQKAPALPYNLISPTHFLYDLVYNPEITQFMKHGIAQGARVQSGLSMLHQQAEQALKLFLEPNFLIS